MKNLLYLLIPVLLISCSTDPQPIDYGQDACDFCDMTIVDRSFSAQAVSKKGKQFKYDAIECMVNDLHDHSEAMAIQQVADFSHPGNMIAVEQALFIVNDSLKSPMGANLAAIKKESSIASPQSADTYYWNDLNAYLLEKDPILGFE
ncbi:nitrous oxide reductase accessory protein NosL [Salinimicrobium sediminilitoris]|uniref:nitrous oxide reductase accessory protein NosL n=1 Tax=Salinimicrobium sediminilitoris TaxID=2876715 RepID=UPI001E2A5228|nr:nitrous oxide reductase accessory protein NosL [Salinimicrobium sediminilitoris]MCC8360361.1 nitrous oxide reductase accessory protein NosL [Salinimicrobium sediminilitoris]